VVYPKVEDQICSGTLVPVTIQNTVLIYGGKMTASGTMVRADGNNDDATDFPMVLKFTVNYYPLGFDPVDDCPGEAQKTHQPEYTWVRVQAQRPSDFTGKLDEFQSTAHSTAIQAGHAFHSVLNFCPTGSNYLAEKWRQDRNPKSEVNSRRKRRSTAAESDNTAEDLYRDYVWETKNTSLTVNHAMATFNEMKVPTRLPGMENKNDNPTGHQAQKCMWCDVTNSRIDMMRAPYTEQAESQVYTDSADSTRADISSAIKWVDGTMPTQFSFVNYRLKAGGNCVDNCDGLTAALDWLES